MRVLLVCFVATCALLLASAQAARTGASDLPKQFLDVMQQNFTGQNFSNEKWLSFRTCMEEASLFTHFPLLDVADNVWKAFLTYSRSNGTTGDPWAQKQQWLEWNPQPLCKNNNTIPGATNVIITEPCDFVSNIAYYSSMLSLCLPERNWTMPPHTKHMLIASFNTLAAGSAFYHGSGTNLGGTLDNVPIGHIALSSLQAAVHELPANFVLANALPQNRSSVQMLNGTQLIANLSHIYLKEDLYKWNQMISGTAAVYQSDYYVTFGSIILVIARLALPPAFIQEIMPIIAKIMSLSPQDTEFLLQEYYPAVDAALGSHNVTNTTKDALLQRSAGTLLKMFYAFFWQEGIFKGPWLLSPNDNSVGGWLIPLVNRIGDSMTGYEHPQYVKESYGVYPGEYDCRRIVAHAKWHEQSANALIDLIYLLDDAHHVILGGNLTINNATHQQQQYDQQASCFHLETDLLHAVLQSGELACLRQGGLRGTACLAHLWTGEHTMDGCLLRNNCLAASPSTGLDPAAVATCALGSCAAHVHSPVSLTSCFAGCAAAAAAAAAGAAGAAVQDDSQFLCAATCVRNNADMSPKMSAIIDCLPTALAATPASTAHTSRALTQCLLQRHVHGGDKKSPLWEGMLRLATQCNSF